MGYSCSAGEGLTEARVPRIAKVAEDTKCIGLELKKKKKKTCKPWATLGCATSACLYLLVSSSCRLELLYAVLVALV